MLYCQWQKNISERIVLEAPSVRFGVVDDSIWCIYCLSVPMETERALEQMGRLGIRQMEIFYNSPGEYETEFLKELKRILDYYGMDAVSMHPYDSFSEPYMFFTGYERRFRDQLERYRWYFEQMQIVGSKIFVFHGDRHDSVFPEEKYLSGLQLWRKLEKTAASLSHRKMSGAAKAAIHTLSVRCGTIWVIVFILFWI